MCGHYLNQSSGSDGDQFTFTQVIKVNHKVTFSFSAIYQTYVWNAEI
jgi:hypothetical protein